MPVLYFSRCLNWQFTFKRGQWLCVNMGYGIIKTTGTSTNSTCTNPQSCHQWEMIRWSFCHLGSLGPLLLCVGSLYVLSTQTFDNTFMKHCYHAMMISYILVRKKHVLATAIFGSNVLTIILLILHPWPSELLLWLNIGDTANSNKWKVLLINCLVKSGPTNITRIDKHYISCNGVKFQTWNCDCKALFIKYLSC